MAVGPGWCKEEFDALELPYAKRGAMTEECLQIYKLASTRPSVTFAEGQQAGWLAGAYNDDYVKVDGEWKYQHLRFKPYLSTPFNKSWSNRKFGPE